MRSLKLTECSRKLTECSRKLTECPLKLTECSRKLTECPLMLTECSIKLTECSLKLSECSLKLTEWNLLGVHGEPVPKLPGGGVLARELDVDHAAAAPAQTHRLCHQPLPISRPLGGFGVVIFYYKYSHRSPPQVWV